MKGRCNVNYGPEFCWNIKNRSCFNESGTLAPWKTVCSPKAIETSSNGVTTPGASSRSDPQQCAAVSTQRSLNNFMTKTFIQRLKKFYLRTVPPQTNPVFSPAFEKNNLTRNGHELTSGVTPLMIFCHSSLRPEAASLPHVCRHA